MIGYQNRSLRQALVVLLLLWPVQLFGQNSQNAAVDFSRDVRPILSNTCFHCHGPDAQTREADLRLDQRQGLFADRDGYRIVTAKHAEHSELLRRILSDDPDEVMPPPHANKTVTAAQKEILNRWIQQGAPWEQHWAFVPPKRPAIPEVSDDTWQQNEIDRFILAKLEAAGLQPSPIANRWSLLRRVYLDLIGLPPTLAEADRWIEHIWPNDSAELDPAGWQKLVDHLLDSPHYGERWARRWLDLARYADTNGYEKDRERSVWPYRDWVVSAINDGMPFDQFTIEQLAGDMLPAATLQQRIATGFHRNTMLNEEGGIDPLEFRYHAMTDRVATTGTTWLGLTLGCCQCHAHKYDPVTHDEYFQIMAYLNNADEPQLLLPDNDVEAAFQKRQHEADELLRSLPAKWPLGDADKTLSVEQVKSRRKAAIRQAFAKWRDSERSHAVDWTLLQPLQATSNLPILTIQADKSIFASGDTAKRDDYEITLAAHRLPVTALRLEALPDDRLPARGPGSTYYEGTRGDFFLTEIAVASADNQTSFPVATASETFWKNRFGKNPASAELAIDGDIQTGWSVHGRQGERHVAVFNFESPVPAGTRLKIHMSFGRHFASSLGRFRFAVTDATSTPAARSYERDVVTEIQAVDAKESVELPAFQAFLLAAPPLAEQVTRIQQLLAPPAQTTALVLQERPPQHPRPTFRHHRGEFLQPKNRVTAVLPEVLTTADAPQPQNRLQFAQWLVSEKNPLTARVVANRHWSAFFGTGLVKTVDDFGLQGETPSHPELLDWLAVTLREDDGWQIRQLHRRIVCSATYQQSTVLREDARQIDPSNRLLSYSPRYRLDAEVVRDQLLVAADVLNPKLGGPPVRPPQPAGVTEVAYGGYKWKPATGRDRFRRSLYTFTKRTAPFAMLSTFDAPSGEACIARRDRSNSPLQALTLLNDVMMLELAQHAGRVSAVAAQETSVQSASVMLFRSILVRPPTDGELLAMSGFLSQQRQHFQANVEQAVIFGNTQSQNAPSTDMPSSAIKVAAWTALARSLFSLDEALTRS